MRRFAVLLAAAAVGCASDPETAEDPRLATLPACGDPSPVSQVQAPASAVTEATPPAELVDSDRIGFPEGYRESFRQFYVWDRFDAGTVAYVCANEIAASVEPGEPYPYGSVILSENWSPLRDDDGELVVDDEGRLIRAQLNAVLLMAKEPGYGEAYGASRSGEWEYVAYFADGSYLAPPEETASCAACHQVGVPEGGDYVFRTDFHFLPDRYARTDPIPEGELGISRMAYWPANHTVAVGETVVWRNSVIDETPHTVSAGGGAFESGPLGPGETFSHTFTEPGEYEYACALHPQQMRGVIQVTE